MSRKEFWKIVKVMKWWIVFDFMVFGFGMFIGWVLDV